tara:strand:+ start:1089 stop:1562 length:474 start_codon:yes stop_codon:yes gene_type:complete
MEDLIEKNMGLVLTVVDRFKPKNQHDKEAYIQAGRIGLWKALTKFSENGGSKFSPYAWNPIKWEIIKEIRSIAGKSALKDIREFDIDAEEFYTCIEMPAISFDDLLPENLTDLESKVIKLKRKGYNFKEISGELKYHRSNIKKIFDNAVFKIREANK